MLAIIGELLNPVAGKVAVQHMPDVIDALVPDDPSASSANEESRSVIEQTISRTVDGAVEVAGIIPTWIAVSAGIAGISSEIWSLTIAATLTASAAVVSAMGLFYIFSRVSYYGLAQGIRRRWLWARNKRELLSRVVISVNLFVILFAFGASFVPSDEVERGPGTGVKEHRRTIE